MRIFIYLFLCISFPLLAQQTPAAPQSKPVAVRGATIHVGNGTVIENGLMLFDQGKIQSVTRTDQSPTTDLSNYKVIEAKGMDVYPGFISPNTNLGLSEIGAVRATNDSRELGYMNPSIRSIIAYSTDSKVTPTVRSNGVLMAQIVPSGGRISGQSTIVELDAWNWEDAAYKMDEGIWLNWPRLFSWQGWRTGNPERKKDEKYPERVQEIEDYLKLAQAYAKNSNPQSRNLKYEAMRGLYDGTKQVYIRVNAAKSIMEAVLLCKKFGVKPIIVGGEEAWRVVDFLATNEIAVILGQTQDLPAREDEDIDQPFKNPKILSEAGVLFGFSVNGSWQQRNLPFQAGQAVAFGLDYEKAIAGLTLNTAKILGIDETVGSLEKGKDATFIICQGDVLDMRTNKISHAFIQGKRIDLDNKQKVLYRKFTEKYESGEK